MQSRGRLGAALMLGLSVVVVQLVGSALSNSLALLADAGHMLTDVLAIALAIVAITLAARASAPRRTFGLYRLEILATVFNGLLLLALSGFILVEAVDRWRDPQALSAGWMIAAALYGVAANVISMLLLRRGAGESLAVRGAYLEVLSDALGSMGVLLAGIAVISFGWVHADALVSMAIALFMIPRTLVLLRDAFGVLMESAPRGVDLDRLRNELLSCSGVTEVHDLHVWTITSGMASLTAHAVVEPDPFHQGVGATVLADLQRVAHDLFGIEHSTFQLEMADHEESGQHP